MGEAEVLSPLAVKIARVVSGWPVEMQEYWAQIVDHLDAGCAWRALLGFCESLDDEGRITSSGAPPGDA